MTYFRLPSFGLIVFASLLGALWGIALFNASSSALAAGENTEIQLADPRQTDSIFGAYLAVSYAEEQADFERAASLLDRLIDAEPNDSALARRALLANIYAGRMDRASALSARVADDFSENLDIAGLLVSADHVKRNDWTAARSALLDRTRISLARFATPAALAWIATGEGDIDGAIEQLSDLRGDEQLGDLHDYNAGLIFLFANRAAEADAILAPYADRLSQAPVLIVRALARARLETDGPEAARGLLQEYRDLQGGIDRIVRDLETLDETNSLPPLVESPAAGIAQTMTELAIRVRRQAPRLALRYLRVAVHLDESNDLGRIVIGTLLESSERHESAIAVLSEIQPGTVHHWAARQEISENLSALERDEEAIALLEEMASERQDDIDALVRLGGLMRTRSRFEEGIDYYDRALARVDPNDPIAWNLHYGRGICYERTQQWALAEPDFLRALELNPDEPYVLNYLGYSWVDQGVRLQEGLEMIEKAVEQRPNDAYIVDSLGWVHYRLGNFEEAVVHLERSVQLRPGNAIINDHLGDAYWHVGRQTEARFQWERSKFLEDADDDLRSRIDDKLERGLDAVETDEAAAEE